MLEDSISTGSKKGTNKDLSLQSMNKAQKPQKTSSRGKTPYLIFSEPKKTEDEKAVEENDNLKNVAVLHDSRGESCGDDSACSDSGGSQSDCKD